MNLKIILFTSYPHGMACTQRIHNYAKGIIEVGSKVQLLVLRPTEVSLKSSQNQLVKGTHEGINFEYTCGTTVVPDSFIKELLIRIKGILVVTTILFKQRIEIDAMLLVSNSAVVIVYFALLSKIFRIKYLQEKSEFPLYNRIPHNIFQKLYQYLYKKYVYKLFDGMLVISHSLHKYFETRIRKKSKLLLVPIMVNTEEFESKPVENANKQRLSIVLCGSLIQKKDGVLTLIQAFKKVSNKFDDIRLYLIGGTPGHEDELKSRQLTKELRLGSNVVFTGFIPRERLVELMCNASVLVLAKPSGLQADYCFPSKLAEYLATGRPVIVTDTGEITSYLQDGVNAFIVEPDSDTALAKKIDFVLSNPDLAQKVGLQGRKVALNIFDYKIQARRIVDFLEELKSKRS